MCYRLEARAIINLLVVQAIKEEHEMVRMDLLAFKKQFWEMVQFYSV